MAVHETPTRRTAADTSNPFSQACAVSRPLERAPLRPWWLDALTALRKRFLRGERDTRARSAFEPLGQLATGVRALPPAARVILLLAAATIAFVAVMAGGSKPAPRVSPAKTSITVPVKHTPATHAAEPARPPVVVPAPTVPARVHRAPQPHHRRRHRHVPARRSPAHPATRPAAAVQTVAAPPAPNSPREPAESDEFGFER